MSSVVSGITKVFSSIGTGLATLGTAVKAVGASFFSAGGSAGSLFSSAAGSTSTLGNIFSGIKSIMSIGPLGAIGDALGSTAQALAGVGPTAGASTGFLKGFGEAFSNPQVVAGLVQGAGVGVGKYLEMKAYEKMQDKNIAAAEAAVQKRQDSYNNLPVFANATAEVPNSVQTPAADTATANTTSNAYAKFNETKEKEVWAYNPETGMVEKKKVSRQPAATSMVA